MGGGDGAFLALFAIFAAFLAFVWWRQSVLVKHLADLLASRSYTEWAQAQNKLARAEAAKKGEKQPVSEGWNGAF